MYCSAWDPERDRLCRIGVPRKYYAYSNYLCKVLLNFGELEVRDIVRKCELSRCTIAEADAGRHKYFLEFNDYYHNY